MPTAPVPSPESNDSTSEEAAPPGRLTSSLRILGAVAGVILALGGGAGIASLMGVFNEPGSSASTAPEHPEPSAGIRVTCEVKPTPEPGRKVQLTYTISSKTEATVDLGAEVYADDGSPLVSGFGDDDVYAIRPGEQTATRPLRVPAQLAPGDYEISGELWPAGKRGATGAETVADAVCATFTVP